LLPIIFVLFVKLPIRDIAQPLDLRVSDVVAIYLLQGKRLLRFPISRYFLPDAFNLLFQQFKPGVERLPTRFSKLDTGRFIPDDVLFAQHPQEHQPVKRVTSGEHTTPKNGTHVIVRPQVTAQPNVYFAGIPRPEQDFAPRAKIHGIPVHQLPKSPRTERFLPCGL
jgi:hypothetical protein